MVHASLHYLVKDFVSIAFSLSQAETDYQIYRDRQQKQYNAENYGFVNEQLKEIVARGNELRKRVDEIVKEL